MLTAWVGPLVDAAVPTITSLGTVSGSTAGGDSVTISGSNFSNIASVRFGNNAASFTVNSSTSITATTPAASSAGLVDISITNNLNETGVLYGAFAYTDASISVNRWLGGATGNQTNWNTPANWSRGSAPTSSDIVFINGGSYQPIVTLTAPLTLYALSVGPWSATTLTVTGGSSTNTLTTSTDLTVGKSGTITPSLNTTTQANSLVLNASGRILVASGGFLNANTRGYSSGNGPGGSTSGSCSHAAHGSNGKVSYGDIRQPTQLGSGCSGNTGGGYIKVTAGSMQLDGQISVNASSDASAGSVWLDVTGEFKGTSQGVISATSNQGSAGRIAVYAGSSTYLGRYLANATSGGSGTVYTKIGSQTYGTLTLSNSTTSATSYATPETATGTVQYDSFKVENNAIYEIPSGVTFNASALPASASSTDPGRFLLQGTMNVPNATTLTNYNLILANGTYSDQNPVIGSGSTVELRNSNPETSWNIQSLTIQSGGVLTHTANNSSDLYGVNVNASTSITINSGGRVDVSQRGYTPDNGPGKGRGGSGVNIGAGHGGQGHGADSTYGQSYGSITQPFTSGSGGSNSGEGGGRIKLTTPSLTHNGTMDASGGNSGYTYGSGGAGGSIWLDTTTLAGSGTTLAHGGGSKGAGGGRIALYYATNTMSGTISATSQDSSNTGGSGTIYQKSTTQTYGSLIIPGPSNGSPAYTPLTQSTMQFDTLEVNHRGNIWIAGGQTLTVGAINPSAQFANQGTISLSGTLNAPNGTTLVNYRFMDNGTYSDQNPIIGSGTTYEVLKTNATTSWNVQSLRVQSGGVLTHPANSTAETYVLNVVAAGDITVASGGSVNVAAKGYTCSNGPGAGGPAIAGVGNGGSYGGAGGRSNTSYPTVLYGSASQPTNIGSGGTCYTGTTGGGSGGGAALLKSTSGNIIVEGTITAKGGTGPPSNGSGGSGGSIWLQASTVTGNGTLDAQGGNAYASNGAAGGGGRIAFTYSSNLAITATTPNRGTIAGGDSVVIAGSGFSPNTEIVFGSSNATVTYNSTTSLTATAPAATAPGLVDVIAKNKYFSGTVTASGGASSAYPGTAGTVDPTDTYQTAALTNGYEYTALTPVISSITPNYGEPAGGNTIRIIGESFEAASTVRIGGVPATSVTYISSTELRAVIPAGTPGTVSVTVTNSNGESVTDTNAYTYTHSPQISGMTPASGSTTGGDSVVINGNYFTPGVSVTFDGTAATNVTLIDASSISVTTPAGERGTADITITNTYGQTTTLLAGFRYLSPAPTVSGFSPTSGTMAGGTVVTFTGSNLESSMKAYFDGVAGTTLSSTVTTLQVETPVGEIGDAIITISGPDTEQLTVGTQFRYVPASYAFTSVPVTLHQTEAGLITVQARNTANEPVIVPHDTVMTLSSTSVTTQFSLDPNSGWGMNSVVIPAGAHSASFYMKDTVKGSPTVSATGPGEISVSRQVSVVSRYKFLLTGVTDPIDAGTPSSVTIQTTDWQGNPLNDYTGTVVFTSSDPFAQLPGNLQFTSEMQGHYTFVNGVTLATNGEHTITATDTADPDITGSQQNITVQNGSSGPATKLSVITEPQTVASNKSTMPITVQIQDTNGNPVPAPVDTQIHITSNSTTGSYKPGESSAWTGGSTYTMTIPSGSSAASFHYMDTQEGLVQLSIRDQAALTDTALTDTEHDITIGAGEPYRLALQTQEAQLSNKWNPITITLRDDQDRRLTIGQTAPQIYLSSANNSLLFAADSTGSNATTSFSTKLVAGTNQLVIYVRSTTTQQTSIGLSDDTPANGSTGLLDDSRLVSYVAQQATRFTMSAADTIAAGSATALTITARNDNGDIAPVDGSKTITLDSTGTGEYSLMTNPWGDITTVNISDGSSSLALYYKNQTAGTATMSVQSPYGQTTRSITITPGSFTALAIEGASSVPVDTATQYTVSLRDVFGNQTTSANPTTSYLYTSATTGNFATSPAGPWTATALTIPTGMTAQNIYYRDSAFGTSATLTVSDQSPLDAPDSGIANDTQAVQVVGQTVDRYVIASPPQTIVAGNRSGEIIIEARTADGLLARVGTDVTFDLSSTSQGMPQFYDSVDSASTVSTITIPAGSSSTSVYYSDNKAGTFTLKAAARVSQLDATQSVNVTAASVDDQGTLIFTTAPQTKESGEASDAIRIATADKYGNETPASVDTTITLGSDCSGSFSESLSPWTDTSTITIAAGNSSAFIYFRSDMTCTMTITADQFAPAQQTHTVENGPYALSVTGPGTLELNQTGTYTVSLLDIDGNVVTPKVHRSLYAVGDGVTPMTSSFSFYAGTTAQTITVTATTIKPGSLIIRDESSTTAPDTGLRNASAPISIIEGMPTQYGVTSLTTSASADASSHLSVSLRNAYGGLVRAPTDTLATLSSTEASGSFYATSDTSSPSITDILIPAGSSAVDVYYHQTIAGQAYIRAQDGGYSVGELDLTTRSGSIVEYRLSANKNEVERGETAQYTVSAYDINGNITPFASGDGVYIDYSGGEISTGAFDHDTHRLTAATSTTTLSFGIRAATTGTHTITISDTYPHSIPDNGIRDDSHVLTIVNGQAVKLSFTSGMRTLERGGVSDVMHIELQNAHNVATVSSSDIAVKLATSSPTGALATSTGGPWSERTFLLEAGSSMLALYYADTSIPSTWQINATADGLASTSQAITVISGQPASLHFVNAPGSLVAYHDSAAIRLELRNRYGYPTNKSTDHPVALNTTADTGEFADHNANWQTNVIEWGPSSQITLSPSLYYRSYTVGTNTITATLSGIASATHTLEIIPQVLSHFVVTNISDPIRVGAPSSIVVIAKDAGGYTVPSYDGTIVFTANDSMTTVPDPYTFVPRLDRGSHTFVNGVRFTRSGEMSVSVTDHVLGISGTQNAITVLGASGDDPNDPTQEPDPPIPPSSSNPTQDNPNSETNNEQSSDPQPSGSAVPRKDNSRSSLDGLFGFFEPVGQLAATMLDSKNAPYTAPTIVFTVFFGYALLFAAAGFREARNAHILAAVLSKEKDIAQEKDEFINLLSHHLRTPITIITGVIDLISFTQKDRDVSELKNMSNRIQQDIENVLSTTVGEVQSVQATGQPQPQNIYHSMRFWGPVGGAVLATILINIIINSNSMFKVGFSAYAYQAALAVVAIAALYFVLRNHELNKKELAELHHQFAMRQNLDAAKNNALDNLAHTIDADLDAFEAALKNEAGQELVGQEKIEDAEQQLTAISDTAKRISTIDSTVKPATSFDISSLLGAYLQLKSRSITQGVKSQIELKPNTRVTMDPEQFEHILDTLLDNAVKYTNSNEPLAVQAETTEGHVAVSVSNTGEVLPANVSTRPFTHGEHTLNETVQGLGLSLYADRLLLESYDGTLVISNTDGVVTTTITLQRASKA